MRTSIRDTIAARATPPGSGALAVLRLSGPAAIATAGSVFRGRRALADLAGFEGAYGWIANGDGPVDEVVAWVYRAPRSYTGEDMVEISCHGGEVPARRVLETLWTAGARPAEPGEFTRRAFVNGRLDLAQAEAVADLIAARGQRAQGQALAQLEGGLSRRVRELASRVRAVRARIEAYLDFGEDVPEPPDPDALLAELAATRTDLDRLAATLASSRRLQEGLAIAITGRANVGKSSLLNALAGMDRALVHETPGTTRDAVDVTLEWAGVPVRLVDTAGWRPAEDPVERAGVERARLELARADVVLWVVDASAPLTPDDREVAAGLDFSRVHLVLNKVDLGVRDEGWVGDYSPRAIHRTSARTGDGVTLLARDLEEELLGDLIGEVEAEAVRVTDERHAHLLIEASAALGRARQVMTAGEPAELAAADLQRALDALADVTGDRAGPELLDEIFRRFCIGK